MRNEWRRRSRLLARVLVLLPQRGTDALERHTTCYRCSRFLTRRRKPVAVFHPFLDAGSVHQCTSVQGPVAAASSILEVENNKCVVNILSLSPSGRFTAAPPKDSGMLLHGGPRGIGSHGLDSFSESNVIKHARHHRPTYHCCTPSQRAPPTACVRVAPAVACPPEAAPP